MKKLYLPETNNDFIFTFLGNPYIILLFIAMIILLIVMIRRSRKEK